MITKYQIQDFLEIKYADRPSFSPNGKFIAFLSNLSGVTQLYLVSCNDGKIEQLTSYEEPISFAFFSPTKNEIMFGMGKGGNEKIQFFLFDVTSKSVRPITDQPEVIHHWGDWARDGKFITYSSNARNGTDFDVYVMEVETGVYRCIFDQGGWCDSFGFSPSRKRVIIRKQHTFLHHDLYLVDLGNGVTELLTSHKDKTEYRNPCWLPDESGFFFISNEGKDLIGLSFYNLQKKEKKYILNPDWDIDRISLTLDGRNLAVIVNDDGYGSLSVFDAKKLKLLPSQNFPKGMIFDTRWSNDGKYLSFSLQTATKNSDIWVWSKNENKYWQLTQSLCRVPEDIFVTPELIHYKSFDGLKIPAFLFLPKDKFHVDKFPAVIIIHGGPEGQYRPEFNSLIQYFVYRGYVVIAPNVRGSSGYGKKYLALDDIEKRMDSVTDLKYLHEFLKKRDEIDSTKIALMGASYGGYMTLAGLTFFPDLWAAGVDIVGFSNLVTFLENTSSWRRALREAEYGYLKTDKKLLESISPLNFLQNIKAPLFVVHGVNDPRVPLSEAEQIVKQLKQMGKKVELLVYPDEGHGLAKLKNRLDAYPKITDFLDSYLKNNS